MSDNVRSVAVPLFWLSPKCYLGLVLSLNIWLHNLSSLFLHIFLSSTWNLSLVLLIKRFLTFLLRNRYNFSCIRFLRKVRNRGSLGSLSINEENKYFQQCPTPTSWVFEIRYLAWIGLKSEKSLLLWIFEFRYLVWIALQSQKSHIIEF